jgi:hypothetical protein
VWTTIESSLSKERQMSTPSYLESVKARLAELNNKNNKSSEKKDDKNKVNFFKPEIGMTYEIRFLPYLDKNNQPFEEVLYYNNMQTVVYDGKAKKQRFIAPFQFGVEDPIATFLEEMHKDTKGRSEEAKTVWKEWNSQRAKPRFYSLLIVRGEEDKGPQIFEMSNDDCVKAYTAFTHKDLVEEDVFDPNTGYDFTLTCAPDPGGKTFNGKAVRSLTFQNRMKPSKLGTKVQMEAWLKMLPELNLHEYFKRMVPNQEKLQTILENYINDGSNAPVTNAKGTGTDHNVARGAPSLDSVTDQAVNEAFKDL